MKNEIKRRLLGLCVNLQRYTDYATIGLMMAICWGLVYYLFNEEALIGGNLFSMYSLAVGGFFAGNIFHLFGLPALLGMVTCGILLEYAGIFNVYGSYRQMVVLTRNISLAIMLVQVGLGLEPSKLAKYSCAVVRLAFIPCIGEAVVTAAATWYLMNMPWTWGLLLGSALGAVSPAIVVPEILYLESKGYGLDKGIGTLVMASSSIDDILSICWFGIQLSLIFSISTNESMMRHLIKGPLEVLIGISLGIIGGFIVGFVPSAKKYEGEITITRSFILGGLGFIFVLAGNKYGFIGAGPLAVVAGSFTTALFWSWQGIPKAPVAKIYKSMWSFFEPLLFGLIGADVRFGDFDMDLLINGIYILLIGSAGRVLSCYIALLGTDLNAKERLFVNLAWLPKATVQAALGPLALDMARSTNASSDTVKYASAVLTISVLSIICTAALGSIGMHVGGPLLLSKSATTAVSKIQISDRYENDLKKKTHDGHDEESQL